jgi:glycogen operon protein
MHLPYNYQGYRCLPGQPLPLGASFAIGGVNFAVTSRHATGCSLVLFDPGSPEPRVEIPIPDAFRFGDVFAITVLDLDPARIEYGFRLFGPGESEQTPILLDPTAKVISGRDVWGMRPPDPNNLYNYRARVPFGYFEWGDDRPLNIPIQDLVVYEVHVRGFTRHDASRVKYPGTYLGMIEKIPYLKELGINAVELMPVWEFDEWEHWEKDPATGQIYHQYWGYNPVGFFAPKAGFAAGNAIAAPFELKSLIKALHQNGIEVILDVVLNHTSEGDARGPMFSYKGIDHHIYYMLTPDGHYHNFSGTGNSVSANHPAVIPHILDCLRYWVSEYHVDGFRFDLASIMTRDHDGTPLADPPLIRLMCADPVLANTKLIAEPWDVGGLYQVGSFPHYGRWSEWNGQFRDNVRRFLKGDSDVTGPLSQSVQGHPGLYAKRGPTASINFVTSHDGFTLRDMVSYNQKHNDQPGGHEPNYSFNYGVEGPTNDPKINHMRERQIRNAFVILLTSLGVPMILMGDEVGRTQRGNNNAYRQDSALSWFDWSLVEQNQELFQYVKRLIEFRRAHPVLRPRVFPSHLPAEPGMLPQYSLHGIKLNHPDYSHQSRALAFLFSGEPAAPDQPSDNPIYVAMNMGSADVDFELPRLPRRLHWHIFLRTYVDELHEVGHEFILRNQRKLSVESRGIAILVGK